MQKNHFRLGHLKAFRSYTLPIYSRNPFYPLISALIRKLLPFSRNWSPGPIIAKILDLNTCNRGISVLLATYGYRALNMAIFRHRFFLQII